MGFTLAQRSWYIIGEEKISVKESHLFKFSPTTLAFCSKTSAHAGKTGPATVPLLGSKSAK